jgi:toxin CcdB
MARFDLHTNPEGPGWLLELQSDLLSGLKSCVVAPVLPRELAPSPARILNPVFQVDGSEAVLVTQFMAAVPRTLLRDRRANLAEHHLQIVAAIDLLMQGF